MTQIDDATREALLRLDAPSAQAQERMLAGAWARIGGEPGAPDDLGDLEGDDGFGDLDDLGDGGNPVEGAEVPTTQGGPALAGEGTAIWGAKIVAATVGLTSAGLLVLRLGAGILSGSAPANGPGDAVEQDGGPDTDAMQSTTRTADERDDLASADESPRESVGQPEGMSSRPSPLRRVAS